MNRRRAFMCIALTLGLSACKVDLGTASRVPAFLETEWRGETVDTIDALIDALLLAQVIDLDGRPIPGRFITFTALPAGPNGLPGLLVGEDGTLPTQPTARILSDFGGIAPVRVRLGAVPGPVGLVVSVFELEETDTLWAEVLPGNLNSITLSPRDTTITVGGSFSLSWATGDFYGNPVEADVEIVASGSTSSQPQGTGALITGNTVGTGTVHAVAGAVTDSIVVQVGAAPSRR